MLRTFLMASMLLANTMWAAGPTVECRFAALYENGDVGLDEIVAYTLSPNAGITGEFDPYAFEIGVNQNALTIGIYLDNAPLTGAQIPVTNVVNLPLGATVFGTNTIFHEPVADFVSLRYECRKVLW